MTRCLTTLLALALLCVPAHVAAAPAPSAAEKPTLDSRLDVRFEATPAADVFQHVISSLGLELQLDAAVEGPVTIWVTRVSARTALNVVCESLGCTWRVSGKQLVVSKSGGAPAKPDPFRMFVASKETGGKAKSTAFDLGARFKRPLPVDMQFQDVPVSTILRAISEVSGLEITAEEPLASKHVTLTGSEKTVEDVLKAVIKQAGPDMLAVFSVRDTGNTGAPTIKFAIKWAPYPAKK